MSAQCSGQTRRKPLLGAPSPVAAEAWYGGLKCGADHLPSVFAEVDHHRGFLLDPTPTIAPVAHGDAKLSGKVRKRDRGHRISCVVEASNDGGPAVATASQAVPR